MVAPQPERPAGGTTVKALYQHRVSGHHTTVADPGAEALSLVVQLVAAASAAGTPEERNDAVIDRLAAAVTAKTGLLLRVDLRHRDAEVLGGAVTPPAAATLRHRLRTGETPGALLDRAAAGELAPCTAARAYGPAWPGSTLQREYRRDWGCDQVAVLPVATGKRLVVYLLGREGGDFTAAELELLGAVQPVVQGLVRLLRLHGDDAAWVQVASGRDARTRCHLTARESEVLALLARGHKAATIARMVGCSERTIHRHLSNAYHKLGVGDRLSAVSVAHRRGLLPAADTG